MSRIDTATLPARGDALHFPWLDPLRFFAALSVLLFHLADVLKFPLPGSGPLVWFSGGFLGVDLFFAISGAVIALSENHADMKAGDYGLLCAFGAGYSIGGALLKML